MNKAATLEELAARFDELTPGEEYPVAGNFCKYCKSTDLVVVIKLEAMPGSLAGMQMKSSTRKVAGLECRGCGHVSRS
jgi:hypothetical protein